MEPLSLPLSAQNVSLIDKLQVERDMTAVTTVKALLAKPVSNVARSTSPVDPMLLVSD